MGSDYSKMSDADLQAVAAGDMTKVSDAGLAILTAEPQQDLAAEGQTLRDKLKADTPEHLKYSTEDVINSVAGAAIGPAQALKSYLGRLGLSTGVGALGGAVQDPGAGGSRVENALIGGAKGFGVGVAGEALGQAGGAIAGGYQNLKNAYQAKTNSAAFQQKARGAITETSQKLRNPDRAQLDQQLADARGVIHPEQLKGINPEADALIEKIYQNRLSEPGQNPIVRTEIANPKPSRPKMIKKERPPLTTEEYMMGGRSAANEAEQNTTFQTAAAMRSPFSNPKGPQVVETSKAGVSRMYNPEALPETLSAKGTEMNELRGIFAKGANYKAAPFGSPSPAEAAAAALAKQHSGASRDLQTKIHGLGPEISQGMTNISSGLRGAKVLESKAVQNNPVGFLSNKSVDRQALLQNLGKSAGTQLKEKAGEVRRGAQTAASPITKGIPLTGEAALQGAKENLKKPAGFRERLQAYLAGQDWGLEDPLKK